CARYPFYYYYFDYW
nr:immunoglobulin heavy chain junction region [Mus musculus]MBK4187001.1 immunoglobulin heavy chain junction region [Mus musculus]